MENLYMVYLNAKGMKLYRSKIQAERYAEGLRIKYPNSNHHDIYVTDKNGKYFKEF